MPRLEPEIGDRDWSPRLEPEIGARDWSPRFETEIGARDWTRDWSAIIYIKKGFKEGFSGQNVILGNKAICHFANYKTSQTLLQERFIYFILSN
jgi:hypothetical protein